jgi:hypothetical protein
LVLAHGPLPRQIHPNRQSRRILTIPTSAAKDSEVKQQLGFGLGFWKTDREPGYNDLGR